jgi:hypothetical protein
MHKMGRKIDKSHEQEYLKPSVRFHDQLTQVVQRIGEVLGLKIIRERGATTEEQMGDSEFSPRPPGVVCLPESGL